MCQIVRNQLLSQKYLHLLVSESSLAPYMKRDDLPGVSAVVELVDVDRKNWLAYSEKTR